MAKMTTADFPCLDSFNLAKFVPTNSEKERNVKLLCGTNELKAVITYEAVRVKTFPYEAELRLDRTKTLKGRAVQTYFLCPFCCERVRNLYFKKDFMCRICAGLIYPEQAVSKYDLLALQAVKLYKKIAPSSNYDITNIAFAPIPKEIPENMHPDEFYRTWVSFRGKIEERTNKWLKMCGE